MKILKKVNTEFGSAWFFNSSVATDLLNMNKR